MTPETTPTRLHLEKEMQLEIDWSDGLASVYSIAYLRTNCPCASCKDFREKQKANRSRLTVLPGNFSGKLTATSAELIGNYAIRIIFSDGHDSGIFSFVYLRSIAPRQAG